MRVADELFELSHDRMTGEAHPGVGQISDGLSVKRTSFAKDIERYAGQRESAGLLEEDL
jgi:hypothetical protein